MGREPVNNHMDKKSNSSVAHSNGSSDINKVHVSSKISEDNIEGDMMKNFTEQNLVANNTHERQKVVGSRSTNLEGRNGKPGSQKSSDDMNLSPSPSFESWVNGNHTVPKPFALATEKHVSTASRTAGVDNNSSGNGTASNSPTASRGSQPNSPLMSRKSTEYKKHHDEEDSCSATSMKTVKPKITIGVAPTFRSTSRFERRKVFYQRLEEKYKALDAEKKENEQRLKEEREAAIKQLRKSMAYKANPVPSFYYEGPPPKVELKKLPLTLPKSPNLNRRKSCGDTVNSPSREDKGKHCARHCHSVDGCKEDPGVTNSLRFKAQVNNNSPRTPKTIANHPRKSSKGTPKSAPEKLTAAETATA